MYIIIQNHVFEGVIVPVVCRNSLGEYLLFETEEAAFRYGKNKSFEFFVTEVNTVEQIDDVLDRELFYS